MAELGWGRCAIATLLAVPVMGDGGGQISPLTFKNIGSWQSATESTSKADPPTPAWKSTTTCKVAVSSGGPPDAWMSVGINVAATTRPLLDGEKFTTVNSESPWYTGIGVCIESDDIVTNPPSIRFNENCVGFYGDGNHMWHKNSALHRDAATSFSRSKKQTVILDSIGNCIYRLTGDDTDVLSGFCYPLPEHFRGKNLHGVSQAWFSSSNRIVGCDPANDDLNVPESCPGLLEICGADNACPEDWVDHEVFERVTYFCSSRCPQGYSSMADDICELKRGRPTRRNPKFTCKTAQCNEHRSWLGGYLGDEVKQ
jgi:hypothetical protein